MRGILQFRQDDSQPFFFAVSSEASAALPVVPSDWRSLGWGRWYAVFEDEESCAVFEGEAAYAVVFLNEVAGHVRSP
jgi:hypothetical protein